MKTIQLRLGFMSIDTCNLLDFCAIYHSNTNLVTEQCLLVNPTHSYQKILKHSIDVCTFS